MGIELEGVDELLRKLGELEDQGQRAANSALREAGNVIQVSIQAEAPVRTGTLRKSIQRSGIRTQDGVKHVLVYPGAFYGRMIELGTVKMRANPFMARGYESSKQQAVDVIADELRKGLGL